ncbi:LysR substrate-binding domain-containing protein [Undibacterium sp. TJN19]|uniref:LysR substrate-binding domain-containing protein n=1 Tax=Undibacterium sp. TJN19 TaxID=3413055 RepID=UPI003BF35210
MHGKLPPLFTLQAFEAAARLGSFSRAADELSLTPGAISRQIRQLEDWSALTLFVRNGPRVSLTTDGTALLSRLAGPLSALHQAVYPPADDAVKSLQIATLASTAKEWLLPRLPDFTARHPDIRLIIHTDYALVKPAPRLAMVALRHGVRQASDQICETLFTDKLVAVAAPHLQASLGTDVSLWPAQAMLQHLSLDAQTWLAAAGLPEEFVPQGQAFNDADVLLEAAQYGLGMALTRLSIVWRRLQEGRLVLACDVVCPSPRDNLLVLREDSAGLPEVRAFTQWIREQAKIWQTQVDGFDPQVLVLQG